MLWYNIRAKSLVHYVIMFMNFLFFTRAKTINGNNNCGSLSGCVAERQPGEYYVVSLNVKLRIVLKALNFYKKSDLIF